MTRRRAISVVLALVGLLVTGTGIAWASGITLTSKKLGASAVTTPVMFPVSVTTTNGGGGAGKIANGDTIVFTWSQPVAPASLCAGNSGGSFNYKWTLTNTAGNDLLAPMAAAGTNPCATGLNMGTVDLGATGYNTSTNGTVIEFTGAHTFSAGNTVLTVLFSGAKNGGSSGPVGAGSILTWTPNATLTDTSGRNCPACLAKTSSAVQF